MSPAPAPRRPARGQGSRRAYGSTWWGRAWIDALEHRARLDPNRLPRGRSYARHARVGQLTVEPGEVRAPVLGSRASAYRVRIRVRPFSPAEWDAVLDAIAATAAHAAALLDGELTPDIVDDVASAGLDLLPGAGEVGTSCSCPDWANPCKHAAAVCYLIADLLDADPFLVLALRGRRREEVVAGLRARRSERGTGTTESAHPTVDPGVGAAAAWATTERPALPPMAAPPTRPGRPAALAVDPAPSTGLGLHEVTALAADAAERAAALAGGGDAGLGLDHDADLGRRAAAVLDSGGVEALASGAGRPARELVRLATAWRHGGAAAVDVLRAAAAVGPDVLDAARSDLAAAGWTTRMQAGGLTVVGAGCQLRPGVDRLWYRLERRGGAWEVVAAPDPEPAALVEDAT